MDFLPQKTHTLAVHLKKSMEDKGWRKQYEGLQT